MANCPRCEYPLRLLTHHTVEVDHCDRCRGNFLETGEGAQAFAAEVEPAAWRSSPSAARLGTALACPRDGQPMTAYRLALPQTSAEVDVCETCGGMWLDAGDGKRLLRTARALTRADKAAAGQPPAPGLPSYFFQLFTGMPIEEWNPVQRRPVFVYGLLAVLAVIFVGELLYASDKSDAALAEAVRWVGLVPADLWNGQRLWTLITHAFLHGGLLHLLGNLYFLWIFGDNVESTLGRRRFVALYALSAVVGGLVQAGLQSDPNMPLIGASGAISGLMGAYLALFPKVKVWVVFLFVRFKLGVGIYLAIWLALQVLMAARGVEGVGWWCHIGGLVAGFAMGLMLRGKAAVPLAAGAP